MSTYTTLGRIGRGLAALIVLAGLFAAIYRPVLNIPEGRGIPGRLDMIHQVGPYAYVLDHAVQQGELPLWNPLMYCGMPYAANPLTMTFYPPHLLRAALTFDPTPWKTHTGLLALIAIHMLLAGLGTYLFARQWHLPFGAALIAGIAYAFSAVAVYRATVHPWLNFMAAWVPFILVLETAALQASTVRAAFRFALAGGLVFGVCLLVGFIQLAIYIGVLTAAYAVLYRLLHLREPGEAPFQRIGRDVGVMAAVYLVAVLIGAALFLPAAELVEYSGRSKTTASEDIELTPVEFSYSPSGVGQLLAIYPGLGEMRDIQAAGAVVLLLAFCAFSSRRWRPAILFGALTWIMLDCSLGPPFPVAHLIEIFAPFELGPAPRAALILGLPLAMLAGFGAQALSETPARVATALARGVWVVLAAGLVAWLVWSGTGGGFFLDAPWLRWTVLALLATVLVTPMPKIRRAAPALLAVAVAIEIVAWNSVFIPHVYKEADLYKGDIQALGKPAAYSLENRRGLDEHPNTNLYALQPVMNGRDSVHLSAVRRVLCPPGQEDRYTRSLLREPANKNPRGNLLFKRMFWLSRNYVDGPLPPKQAMFPAAATAFLDTPPPIDLPRVERDALPEAPAWPHDLAMRDVDVDALNAGISVHPSGNAKVPAVYLHFPIMDQPKKHSILQYEIRTTSPVTVDPPIQEWLPGGVLGSSSYLPVFAVEPGESPKAVQLPLPDYAKFGMGMNVKGTTDGAALTIEAAALLTDRSDEDERIEITAYGPNAVEVVVHELPGPRILTYLDGWYPGWRAYVNGERVELIRSAEAFKAIELPAGTHRVRFEFRPWRVYAGVGVSILAALAVLVGMRVLRSRRGPAVMESN